MDFKSLISKLDSMEAPPETPQAPKLPEKIQLDEDAQLRVLAGTSTILAEAAIMEKKLTKAEKEKKEEVVKSMKKDKAGFKERYGKRGEEVMHATATKIARKKAESVENQEQIVSELDMNLIKAAQKGMVGKTIGKPDPESDKNVKKKYGYRMDGEPAERDDDPTKQERRGRKRKNEEVEINIESFKSKFMQMVEAAKKDDKKVKGKKAEEKMDEAKKPDANKDGIPDYAQDGKGAKDLGKGKKPADKDGEKKETKGLSAKQKKLPPGLQKAIAAKKGKKTVKESIEPKLSFREMMKLVVESGGQQQIDPLDKELFNWATRVANNKLGEGMKAEVYAGLIYERMGGRFEMFDVLSENKK